MSALRGGGRLLEGQLRVNRAVLTMRRSLPAYPNQQTISEPTGTSQTAITAK